MSDPVPIPFRNEVARKAIHVAFGTITAAILIQWSPSILVTVAFAALAAFSLGVDYLRLRIVRSPLKFVSSVGGLMRAHENTRTSGASMLCVGFALSVLLLPPPYATVGILFVSYGDAAAALVGRALGRHRVIGKKSLEGMVACFSFAIFAGAAVPSIGYWPLVLGATAVTILEVAPIALDDNILLPLAGGGVTWLGMVWI